jgi:hypothetical protein
MYAEELKNKENKKEADNSRQIKEAEMYNNLVQK